MNNDTDGKKSPYVHIGIQDLLEVEKILNSLEGLNDSMLVSLGERDRLKRDHIAAITRLHNRLQAIVEGSGSGSGSGNATEAVT